MTSASFDYEFAQNYCVTARLLPKKPDRLLSITAQLVKFRVKSCFLGMTFCRHPFVFMYIPGGCSIFNISTGQYPVLDLDYRVGGSTPLLPTGFF